MRPSATKRIEKEFPLKKKKLLAIVYGLVLIAGIYGISYLSRVADYKANIASLTFDAIDLTTVCDGTYIGEYDAGMISARVQVTVENHVIKDIILLEHKNDRGKMAEAIVDHMIEQQRTDVDTITGATNSGKVIRKAVEHALAMGIVHTNG